MSSKKNILMTLESQADKIVLAVVIVVSLVVLWLFVLSNPYGDKVGRKSVSPGTIDKAIQAEADRLLSELEKTPVDLIYNKTYVEEFSRQLGCPIERVSSELVFQFPGIGDTIIEEDRLYDVPVIPSLYDVQMAMLRGAARVPVDAVNPGNPYKSVPTKTEDIDLVTVSGRFDIQTLYNNFRLAFDGPSLKSSWKDPAKAKPVFARLELQRRVQQADGSWSDWQALPRTKIDVYHERLGQLPLNPDEMQFGIDVWMSQFKSPEVQLDIIQPESYLFDYADTEWMPPQYLNETNELVRKEKEEEKRKLREERQKSQTDRQTDRRRPTTTTRDRQTNPRRGGGMMDEMMTQPDAIQQSVTRPRTQKERTPDLVKKEMEAEMLKDAGTLSTLREPLLVWAHDDTAKPGQTYQYRMRLGVFNPIMGKDWFRQSQAEYKDQTVLWSVFTDPTESLAVPKMLHVFPMDVLAQKDGQTDSPGITVEVAKYYMGQWQRYPFEVYPGQVIGAAVPQADVNESLRKDKTVAPDMVSRTPGQENEMIDFTTPFVMVDLYRELQWDSRFRRGMKSQMLYYDNDTVCRLPVGKSDWTREIKSDYDAVNQAIEERTGNRQLQPGGMEPGFEMMDPMFMQM